MSRMRGKHIKYIKGARKILRDVYEFLEYAIRVVNGIIVEIRHYPESLLNRRWSYV